MTIASNLSLIIRNALVCLWEIKPFNQYWTSPKQSRKSAQSTARFVNNYSFVKTQLHDYKICQTIVVAIVLCDCGTVGSVQFYYQLTDNGSIEIIV